MMLTILIFLPPLLPLLPLPLFPLPLPLLPSSLLTPPPPVLLFPSPLPSVGKFLGRPANWLSCQKCECLYSQVRMYGWQKRVAEPHVPVTVSVYSLCRVPQGLCHTVLSWATHQYTGIRYLSQHPPQLLKCLWIEGGSVSASSATQPQVLSSHLSIYIYLLVFEIWRNIYHLSQRMCVWVCVPLAPHHSISANHDHLLKWLLW